MRKLFSAGLTNGTVHFSLLLTRLVFGGLILTHGWPKLMNFAAVSQKFPDPFHIGRTASLGLIVFSEVFCGVFVILGLLTRLAAIPLIVGLSVAIFMIHANDAIDVKEKAIMFLAAFVVILFCGPGKVSVDNLIGG
ncbi:DoxX family protein [Chitinophaga agrisoli]|uniref:DoxX family protein n=1 Tax=Chitinophaga agrisoli TaxID=2607653 RepID=A0A5B2VV66_9BACT|nr:DoxX family protein [Chitinophaga agrisoli]KAA2243703.1 DoxX family protein [Chitinophaga agrisoli]